MPSLGRKTAYVLCLQLVFLSATWLAGIYVNGFVPIVPGTSTEVIILNPAVESHIVLASLSAATGVFILALAWAGGSRRLTAASLLALLSMVVAGDSGVAFVLGGGSDDGQSMIMAAAFVTAVFLTFLSMVGLGADDRPSSPSPRVAGERAGGSSGSGTPVVVLCSAALLFFYAVFVTGIYVNLFVAGPVFSLPPNSELAAFTQAEHSLPFVTHEALGAALLAILIVLTASLWFAGARRLSLMGAVPALLVAYSAYVGSLDLTSPPVPASPGGALSILVPMLSAAGFMAAAVVTMLLFLKIGTRRPRR